VSGNTSRSNARTHSKRQLQQIARSLEAFGFTNPVLIDEHGTILAGHGRVEAARLLGRNEVPTLRIEGMSEAEKRAYVITDNRIAEKAGWDRQILAIELGVLSDLLVEIDLDVTVTGFEPGEVDALRADFKPEPDAADEAVPASGPPVTRPGDLWRLGQHRLLCADAREHSSFERLLAGARAQIVITDPPYNVRVDGHVGGNGKVRHREFAMASGEMSESAFTAFLAVTLGHCAAWSQDGSVHYVFMDWRHVAELIEAGREVYTELKNICVWVKTNAGQGSFYRSQHELVLVFKNGDAPHINTFGLGENGRTRSNVWTYAGVNTFRAGRMEELLMHPTVKPVSLIADALRDCSAPGGIVLDAFGGSGTTLIAAERVGRRAALLEIDPAYVDVTIRRWQQMTGKDAVLGETGETFDEIAARCSATEASEVQTDAPAQPRTGSGEEDQDRETDAVDEGWLRLMGGAS
jgi:DNA modification methylase